MIIERYNQDIRWLEALQNMPRTERMLGRGEPKIFLQRLEKFLSLVGNPHKKLRVIHIAGTSGKGSTTKILHDLIASAGFRVGAYTSPHSTVAIEKVMVNGRFISPGELHTILEKTIKPTFDKYIHLYDGEPISYFEAWTVIALLYFVQKKCDWVILETGLGGTHDSTNIVPKPKITAITNIGLDHMELLGNTKEKIASDKAGIIKRDSLFLTTESSPKIKKILIKKANAKKAKYVELKDLASAYRLRGFFASGRQQRNLNLALNIIDVLKIRPKNISRIANDFRFICRQEIVSKKPLVILDGSHNPDKLNSLIYFLKSQKYKRLHLLVGFAQDKHYAPALRKIAPKANHIYLTRFLMPMRRSADLKLLYKIASKHCRRKVEIFSDPWQALNMALTKVKPGDLLLITGSFYLAGELRGHWISPKYMLKNLKQY